MLEFFGLQSWTSAMLALVGGTFLGFLFGFLPGIGGRIGIILLLPVASLFSPYEAAIFLFAMHSVVNTSGAIPNIAFGIPSSPSDLATILDGYPLAKMGRAGEALGASLSASAIGGVLGAIAFLAAIPIAKPLVTSFGPPEFLMLAIFGITMVTSLSREGLLPGLVVAGLGILVAVIGIDFRTGEPRLTFGFIELWSGVGLPAIVCGLFVVPEMLTLKPFEEDAHRRAVTTTIRDVFKGMFVTLDHMAVVLRSTFYGIAVGAAPALGSTISVWMSYAYAARTTKSEIPFGQGAIAGVIAPEAANNSKEGGAMIPTLLFAIPGSSGMAIMMGALAFVGVGVGPQMLGKDIGLSYSLAATIFLANLIVVPMFFMVIPSLVRMAALKREAIVPFAIAASVFAAIVHEPQMLTVLLIVIGSLIGIGLKLADWPRAPFVLGFVIGDLAEISFHQTVQIYGWNAFTRPVTLILALFVVGWIIHTVRSRPVTHIAGPRRPTIVLCLGLLALFAFFLATTLLTVSGSGKVVPASIAAFSMVLVAVILFLSLRSRTSPEADTLRHVVAFALSLAVLPIVGLVPSSIAFIVAVLRTIGVGWGVALVSGIIFGAVEFALLATIFDVAVERAIIGVIAWRALGF